MRKWYKSVAAAAMGAVLLFNSMPVQAAVDNGAVYPIASNEIGGWPQGPEMYGETAVLMEADTGAVLFSKGMDEKRYPASITKVMTALLAIENTDLSEEVVFTEECLEAQASDSTNIGMQVGEVLTMEQCLMALMIKSANDVAIQMAVEVSGSVTAFAELMNQRAKELGCTNTNFVNPNGLPDENHYTTARDMALIFREALKHEEFRNVISTLNYTIEPTNMNPESRTLSTHNALMVYGAPEYYEGCIGGKTGNTLASRCTLVNGAEKNGMTLIAVSMRAEAGQVCVDNIQMFDYGFQNFTKTEVPGGSVVLPAGVGLSDLEVRETFSEEATEQSYYYQGEYFLGTGVKEVPTPEVSEEPQILKPDQDIQETTDETDNGNQELSREETKLPVPKQFYRYAIYLLCALIGGGMVGIVWRSIRNRGKKKRNKRQ